MSYFRTLLLILFAAFPLGAQQARIPPRAVVNAASFARPGLPNGSLARGSIFTIFGSRIGPDASLSATEFPLSTSLSGVQITVSQGDTSVDAIPLFVSAGQINAILPSDAPLGRVSIVVRNGTRRSNPAPAVVVPASLGLFTVIGAGSGPAVVQNFVSQTELPINSLDAPAAPGQTLIVYGTGLGAASFADNEAAQQGNIGARVEVFVGGTELPSANVLYWGRSPCCAGLDQIVIRLPQTAPSGCYVPLRVRAGEVISNTVTLAIAPAGQSCSDPHNALSTALRTSGDYGAVYISSVALEAAVDFPAPPTATMDVLAASFRRDGGGSFYFNPLVSLPPPGACQVFSGSGDFRGGAFGLAGAAPTGGSLDAGPSLRLSGPGGTRNVGFQDLSAVNYLAGLGGSFPASTPRLYLSPGAHTLSSAGGADVGAFESSFDLPPPLTWANRAEVGVVERSTGLELAWSGAQNGVIALAGNYDLATDSFAAALCVASGASGSLTIPSDALAALPPSSARPFGSQGAVALWSYSSEPSGVISAPGLDAGFVIARSAVAKTVIFK
ncbi:MAG: hypothetical protein KDC27_11905 [Acidobacteria bacterium]|nr:hypothetical protein [Acidobacteriota bacterium]